MRTICILVILILLALAVPAVPAHAGGVVTVCDEAHLLAALASGGMVTFTCSGTIILSATITIATDTTIDGSGQDVTISGNNAVRVISVTEGVALKLSGLTVADGSALAHDGGGGGIRNTGGAVTVTGCIFSGNEADFGGAIANQMGGTIAVSYSTLANNFADFGGGILSYGSTVHANNSLFSANNAREEGGGIHNSNGTLIVSDSTFDGNGAGDGSQGGFGGGLGGAIYNHHDGTATISRSSFTGNRASGAGGGGGIFSSNVLDVNSSWFSDNYASGAGGGGGILNGGGSLTVSDCTFSDNTALVGNAIRGGSGGAILSFGTATVSNCMFVGNTADGRDFGCGGGGISLGGDQDSTSSVSNSTFTGNSTISEACGGGGVYNRTSRLTISNCTFQDNSSHSGGGGIYNDLSIIYLSGSTLVGNHAYGEGGGVYNHGTLIASNNTFYSNGAESGGGVYNYGTLAVSNNTLAGNYASSGGSIYNGHPYGAWLENTIVANSPAGSNCAGNASIFDGSGNLSFPDATCPGINADPVLGPLQDNGGPTWTMALGPGSAALDAADDAICAAAPVNNLDQRGFVRPWGSHCDIGALEQVQEPAAVRLSTISAESASGAIPPIIVFGLFLVALASIGTFRRVRQMRCD